MSLIINPKDVPPIDSSYYNSFYTEQSEIIKNGYNYNGTFVHGWLHWHLNMWNMFIDEIDGENILRRAQKPHLRDNEWLIAEHIAKAEKERKGLIIIGSRRLGKALKNEELLYTPNGSYPIGEAKVGDKIYDHSGKLTTITDVFPQGKVPLYEITFGDGRKVKCCGDHLWNIRKLNGKFQTMNTTEIIKGYRRKRIHNGYKDGKTRVINEYKYRIQISNCIQYPSQEVPLEPYYLGLWLGDGTSRNTSITTADDEIVEYLTEIVKKYNLKLTKATKEGNLASSYTLAKTKGQGRLNPLKEKMKSLNIIHNKHIPVSYLQNSKRIRMEVLKGLMDSDGYCAKDGTIQFSTSSLRLKKDVECLIRSLGIGLSIKSKNAVLDGVIKKETYTFTLFTNEDVFKLSRKKSRVRKKLKGKKPKTKFTSIANIEQVEDSLATCIMVDNEEKLFLTSNFIVTHNSCFISSYIARSASVFEGSENVIVGNNKDDLAVLAQLTEQGLGELPEYFKHSRLLDDWSKQVQFGYKNKDGSRNIWSNIYIRNAAQSKQTEVAAGLTPKSFVMDEIGKESMLDVFNSAIPSFSTPFGWRAVPILIGTGGAFDKGNDAQKIFEDPDAYNMLICKLPDEGDKDSGLFIPGSYSMEFPKIGKTLAEFTGNDCEEFKNTEIQVSTHDENKIKIKSHIKKLEKAKDVNTLLKYKMYFPIKSTDCFLKESDNNFPVEAAMQHLEFLKRKPENMGIEVELKKELDNTVSHKEVSKQRVWEYPHDAKGDLDAPIIIYEMPIVDPEPFLYIAGGDPYNTNESVNSPSLGSIYIFKRLYDPIGGTYQNRIVASYSARPKTMKEWHHNVENLLEFYNATIMIENEGTNFIQYMDNKNKSHLLAEGYSLLKEITPNTSIRGRNKGLPATRGIIKHCMNILLDYCLEEIVIAQDLDGNHIKALGITRINDPVLLEEIIKYEAGANVDRIVAFRHVLCYGRYLERTMPLLDVRSGGGRKESNSDFSKFKKDFPFSQGRRNPFN